MNITLGDYNIPVEIIRKNNKNIYFRFKNNTLYVNCSPFLSQNEINKIIQKNKASLLKMYEKVQKQEHKDLQFTYLGTPYVRVFDESIEGVTLNDGFLYAKNEKVFNSWYKKECLRIFENRLQALLPLFQSIPPFTWRIRNMKTRWGVNNVTKRIITLNSELLKKDITLIDYVIVHELCHFYEANHSPRFWEQVKLRYPQYKTARKELR